jgi:hypothetical protein
MDDKDGDEDQDVVAVGRGFLVEPALVAAERLIRRSA